MKKYKIYSNVIPNFQINWNTFMQVDKDITPPVDSGWATFYSNVRE
jgi:predicted secreted Zn-dependent protease